MAVYSVYQFMHLSPFSFEFNNAYSENDPTIIIIYYVTPLDVGYQIFSEMCGLENIIDY